MGNPRHIDSPPPECLHMLGWTAKYASTHHLKIPLPLSLRIRGRVRVPLGYHISHTNFSQSSSSGSRTLIIKNDMDVKVSGRACLMAYRVFATRLRNANTFLCLSFLKYSSTTKSLTGAAMYLVPLLTGAAFSKAVMVYSM